MTQLKPFKLIKNPEQPTLYTIFDRETGTEIGTAIREKGVIKTEHHMQPQNGQPGEIKLIKERPFTFWYYKPYKSKGDPKIADALDEAGAKLHDIFTGKSWF